MNTTIGFNTDAFIKNLMLWCHAMYTAFLDTIEPVFEFLGSEFVIGDVTISLGAIMFGAGFLIFAGFAIFKFLT